MSEWDTCKISHNAIKMNLNFAVDVFIPSVVVKAKKIVFWQNVFDEPIREELRVFISIIEML